MTGLSHTAATMPRKPTIITPKPTAMRKTDPTRFCPSDSVANSLFSMYSHSPIASETTPRHCRGHGTEEIIELNSSHLIIMWMVLKL